MQREALERAIDTVTRFHELQTVPALRLETAPGVVCERMTVPLEAVGLYVPAGTAPLPSTALMLAVPAKIAGCPIRVMCTPPRPDGTADPAVLVAARLCGVRKVFKLGGAQAIAAMAYGTASVPKVVKIFGPGNSWVTAAKQIVAQDAAGAALDMPAGPSEVMVIADESARPAFVAADLLAQAEHSVDAQVLLVTVSRKLADACVAEVARQLAALPRRDIAAQAIAGSRVDLVPNVATAMEICNLYAPEHLILQVTSPRDLLPQVRNAGSVFLGAWTPETMGDYCSGTNHVLPTYGHARAYSGLGVIDFVKRITVQELTPDGLRGLGPTARTLAQLESLEGHANAVSVRLDALAQAGQLMTNPILALARPDILQLQPYQHAAWDPTLERMHANEMPWRATGDNTTAGLNRYPEPQPRALVERMSQLYGAPATQLLVGRGSDEAIDLLVRAFCRAGQDNVVITPPTFGFYKVAAKIQGAGVLEVPLLRPGFSLDTEQVIAAGREAKIVFLCSPNNPTGNLLDESAMLRVCSELAGKALVVVDEAYVEFCGRPSLVSRLAEFPNLVVLRTLSKAYALAGARLGTVIASEDIIGLLRRIIPPYAIPASTVEEVLMLTEAPQRATAAARIRTLLDERARMAERLERCANVARVYPSDANFLLLECRDSRRSSRLARQPDSSCATFRRIPGLAQCLRISIGTPAQNERLLAAVEHA